MKLIIRPFEEGDRNLVMHSWMNSWAANRSRLERVVPMTRALAGHRRLVELTIANSVVRVGVVKPDPTRDDDLIVGWICAEPVINGKPGVLHYAFVKKKFRGNGVFRELLADVGELAFASPSDTIAKKLGMKLGLGYAPGLLYYPATGESEET